MSKKNNQGTRRNAHKFALKREKEAQELKTIKAAKKKLAEEREAAIASLSATRIVDDGPSVKSAAVVAGVAGKKFKRKGIRIRKNASIRGIRIQDAASKREVKEILAAEEAMREAMLMGEEPVEEKKKKKKTSKTLLMKRKASAKARASKKMVVDDDDE